MKQKTHPMRKEGKTHGENNMKLLTVCNLLCILKEKRT